MSAISTILTRLRAAIWAIDVRDDIANAIEQCYSDVSNPTLKTEALEAALQNKIDQGEMAALTIGDGTITAAKLASGVIDNTLATSGAAADAKKVGDELGAINESLGDLVDLSTVDKTSVVAAINEVASDGLSDNIKRALLACFQNVAWNTGNSKFLYNELQAALYAGEWGTDYTWLYRADRDGVFSTNSNLISVSQQGAPIEAISGGLLNVQVTDGALIYKIKPLTSLNAILKVKVRFNSLPKGSFGVDGFRMQISNGESGAQFFVLGSSNDNFYTLRVNAGDKQYIALDNVLLNQWYVISCELRNGKQIITVDDNAPLEYDALSIYACTESRIIVQDVAKTGIDVDVAWVTFKNNDI